MARLSVKLREKKRRNTVEKFKAKRAALFEIIHNVHASDEDREADSENNAQEGRVFDEGGAALIAVEGPYNRNNRSHHVVP